MNGARHIARALGEWWAADTNGWPTAITIFGIAAYFMAVGFFL